jgi:phenylpropionate dioxygenase-like ring-hydroxylating dioxygenase large terminal subunit
MLVSEHAIFRRFWYPVVPMSRLADGPKPFTLLGTEIAVWLDSSGAPAAVRDRCCHRTAKLSCGFSDGDNIVCGYHGWTFDRSGRCVRVPQRPDSASRPRFGVAGYRCVERYGYAWVALDEPLYPIPEIEEAGDPAFRRIEEFYEAWDCSALRLMENMFDPAHLAFVHADTFGTQADLGTALPEIVPFDGGFTFVNESRVRNSGLQKKNLRLGGDETVRRRFNIWWMPFAMKLGIAYPNGLRHTIIVVGTPIDDRRTQLIQFVYRNDAETDAKAADIVAFDRAVTLEDKRILEAGDADVPLMELVRSEHSMVSDKAGLVMRRMLRDLFGRYTDAAGALAPAGALSP